MRKLLLGTAAVALGLGFAAPANAEEGLKLDLGGYYNAYLVYNSQDEVTGGDETRDLDMLRDSELHFTGETTLDNGLTVGAHFELNADGNGVDLGGNTAASEAAEESYLYFSGGWGRVNVGAEDGAAYLLQVAAPSANSAHDGLRQTINPFNYDATVVGATLAGVDTRLDYDMDESGLKEKITYMTPVFNGFQAGVSYTPDVGLDAGYTGRFGVNQDDEETLGSAYEIAARYEGNFENVGVIVGAGYSHVEYENDANNSGEDDAQEWNVGVDLDIGPFGIGAAYLEENNEEVGDDFQQETWVVGADYTTGPFKLGATYTNRDEEIGTGNGEVESDRYTGGVVYTYGPGMSFRGTITYVDHDVPNAEDIDGTAVMLGTHVSF